MFKLMSTIFTTGVAVGAAGVLIVIRRGHMHLEPNQPDTTTVDEEAVRPETVDESGGNNGATTAEPVTVHSERLSS